VRIERCPVLASLCVAKMLAIWIDWELAIPCCGMSGIARGTISMSSSAAQIERAREVRH